MSTLGNEIYLEDLTETIFEDLMRSFKELTPADEAVVWEVAAEKAKKSL